MSWAEAFAFVGGAFAFVLLMGIYTGAVEIKIEWKGGKK